MHSDWFAIVLSVAYALGGADPPVPGVSARVLTAPSSASSNGPSDSFVETFPPNFDDGILATLEHAGRLYVGGYFRVAGEGRGNGVCMLDGVSWRDLEGGIVSWTDAPAVTCLEEFEGDVFAGGHFLSIGDAVARHVARWDGSSWQSMEGGLGGVVDPWAYSMTEYRGELYVGGRFGTAGGQFAFGVARWNGEVWQGVGGGVNAPVYAFAEHDSSLYVGGDFTRAGTEPVSRVARWDGVTWHPVGDEIDGTVRALASYEGSLYAGGDFTGVGEDAISFVARWDGVSWNSLRSGVDDQVFALRVHDQHLYVGGAFTRADGVDASCIATWDGGFWSPLSSGMNFSVRALGTHNGRLVAAGFFVTAGGNGASRIAELHVDHWEPVSRGFNGAVYDMVTTGDTLYAVGAFTTAGDLRASHVVRWNGQRWSPVGAGPTGPIAGEQDQAIVAAVESYKGAIYVGGRFSSVNGQPAAGVAYWDGVSWAATPGDIDGFVWTMTRYETDLFVGGDFTNISGIQSDGIAQWNGSTWASVGGGVNGAVFALAEFGGELYVGGEFAGAGVTTAQHIARWDGTTWKPLLASSNGISRVRSLYASGALLHVGGVFSAVAGVPASNIATWDGASWASLGSGLNAEVISIAGYRGSVYAGGRFYASGTEPALHVARWDGTAWCSLGTGLNADGGNGDVRTLVEYDGSLFLGGSFSVADGYPSGFVARWKTENTNAALFVDFHVCWCGVGARLEWTLRTPFNDMTFRIYRGKQGENYRLIDAPRLQQHAGRIVFQDVSALPSDSYSYRVIAMASEHEVGSFEIDLQGGVPSFFLHDSAPNPVTGSSKISFELDVPADAQLVLYDVAGRRVKVIMPATALPRGSHTVSFDTNHLAAGVYFYRLLANTRSLTRKLVIAK